MRAALLLLWLLGASAFGQGLWQPIDETPMLRAAGAAASARRHIVPEKYRVLELDRPALERQLVSAKAATTLELPLPDGRFARFAVRESPVMEPELAAKFPAIKTYVAQGLDDPAASARLDLTPHGFHAIILSPGGDVFIDPYWRDDDRAYVVYRKADFARAEPLRCLPLPNESKIGRAAAAGSSGAILRQYRLALACTGEYASAVSNGPPTVLSALSAMVTSVNRVSALYERDLAIRFLLVATNDQIVYLDAANDPYTNSNGSLMLAENQDNLDRVIGAQNYDLGHVFSTGGGGIASVGVVCLAEAKARGVTGRSVPTGDPFDVDYVAHEIGHQFGGHHTFNSNIGNCGGSNRQGAYAYEVGSGSTVMAYAGICTAGGVITDLAPHSDDYFHARNSEEMLAFAAGSGDCALSENTGNHPPVVSPPAAFTIPVSTPFALTASASDADGDTLTYCWEELDLGPAQSTAAPASDGTNPVFRSRPPTLSPTRVFPALPYVLDYANAPPATIGASATGEILPTISRTLNFRVTVRDNRAGGGGASWAATTVTTSALAGPFTITSFNAGGTVPAGSAQTITWNVANTDAPPVNCASVKISLSTDGGHTFPFVLAENVPNVGRAGVLLPGGPEVATTQGRIKVEAVGNIFFDLSDADFTIATEEGAPVLGVIGSLELVRGTPVAASAVVASVAGAGPFSAAVSDAPEGIALSTSVFGNAITLGGTADCRVVTAPSGRDYPVTLTVTDHAGARAGAKISVKVLPNPSPSLGTYPPVNANAGRTVAVAPSAPPADANGNLPAAPLLVRPETVPGGGTITIDQATGVVTLAPGLDATLAPFTVRVSLADTCGATVLREFAVAVGTSTESYLAGYGLTGSDAAPELDFDFDGLPNLLEYALGLDPTKPEAAGRPLLSVREIDGAKYLALTFHRSARATDLCYTVQASGDLHRWSDLASSFHGGLTSGPGFVGESGSGPDFRVEVRDLVPFDAAARRFLRLQITAP